jgi:ribosomal-protein-alanine N-acetyltransferase
MLELNFNPFPVLETERLILREVRLEDATELFRMRSNPRTMQYIPRPVAKTKSDATKLIRTMKRGIAKNEGINWTITFKQDPKLIGIIGYYRISKESYRGEVGYILAEEHHGKGIMNEALEVVLKHGFEKMGFHTIEGVIDPGNIASEKLLLKNGFVKEGHFRENLLYEGQWLDSVHYTLFKQGIHYPSI